MKQFFILLTLFLFAVLQGAVLPLNLVLLVVLTWSAIRPLKEGLMVAFWAGFFLDLAQGTPLGFSSLMLLIIAGLFSLYSRRFDLTHPLFLALFVFLASLVWNLIAKEPWLGEGLILAALSLLIRPIIKFYQEDITHERLRLKFK